jgi:hypothetical protein
MSQYGLVFLQMTEVLATTPVRSSFLVWEHFVLESNGSQYGIFFTKSTENIFTLFEKTLTLCMSQFITIRTGNIPRNIS